MGATGAGPSSDRRERCFSCPAGRPAMRTSQRGTALLEAVVVGFAILIVVGQALVTLGRLESAGLAAEEAARHAATWATRHGDLEAAEEIAIGFLPDARVTVSSDGDGIVVDVALDVPLLGPDGSPLTRTVHGRAAAAISPYRSQR